MKKIISSILATSFILATCAMNVMAAPTTRTISAVATPSADLQVGDTVVVDVVLDKTLDLFSADYTLKFDPEVFTIDTAKVSRVEKYIDSTWYATSNGGIRDTEADWAYFMGLPTKNQSVDEGWIYFSWMGDTNAGSGVDSESAQTNRIIGKFNLTVKALPADATSSIITFSDANTAGFKENTGDTVMKVPCTVNFKAPTPVENPWAFTVTTDVNAKKTNGYIWDVTGTKGDGDLTSFVATFTNEDETATGEDKTLIKTIDGADLAALSNWNTAPAFAIGLKTDKAVTADFTATSTKDGKTINATIAR